MAWDAGLPWLKRHVQFIPRFLPPRYRRVIHGADSIR